MKTKPAIGILGGMGPEASSYLYNTLIQFAIKYFGAKHNSDFPEIILHSVPVPDFISHRHDKAVALQMLKQHTKIMNTLHLSCLSIACNTAHLLLDQLQAASTIPFISIIDQVVLSVNRDTCSTVGILASPVTLRSKLYQRRLEKDNIHSILPSTKEQKIIEEITRNVIAGRQLTVDRKRLIKIAENLRKKGVQGIILGCTELPLLFPKRYQKVKVYNSVEILAIALLQNYYKSNTIQQYE